MRFACTLLLLSISSSAAAQAPALTKADELFQARRWADAEAAYIAILAGDSTASMAWYRLGRLSLEGKNDPRTALTRFQAALRHGFMPAYFANLGIARAHTMLGQSNDAIAILEKLANNSFSQPDAITGDSIFARLASHAKYVGIVQQMKRNVEPCEHMPEARQFDFWIGSWDVFAPNGGMQLGTNRIEKMLRGCALQENWTDRNNRDGKSLNFFDPQEKTWRQIWVADNGSTLDYRSGAFTSNAMVFNGKSIAPNGAVSLQKLTFVKVSADTVRQIFEASVDAGKTWSKTWEGIYVKRR